MVLTICQTTPFNIDMKTIIKKILREQEWFEEASQLPNIPKPDGKERVVIFSGPKSVDEINYILEYIYSKGYRFRNAPNGPNIGTIATVATDTQTEKDTYIRLRPQGLLSHGYGEMMFSSKGFHGTESFTF